MRDVADAAPDPARRRVTMVLQSFPPVLIAKPLGFTEEPFYEDGDVAIQTAPKVSFPASAA